jgi:hypothetical protein
MRRRRVLFAGISVTVRFEPNGLRYGSDCLEDTQTPSRVAIAKVLDERLVARRRCGP